MHLLHIGSYLSTDEYFRKHLTQDLMPYTCIVPGCAEADNPDGAPFPNRSAWLEHSVSYHAGSDMLQTLCCPLCWKTMDGEEQAYLLHISRHLVEIALAALPRGAGSEDSSDASDSDTRSVGAASLSREGEPFKHSPEGWGSASDEEIEKARQYWGYLFTAEKMPTPALAALLRSIAIYIVRAAACLSTTCH